MPQAEVEQWRKAHDWAHEQWAKKRNAAEARARRAEDALRELARDARAAAYSDIDVHTSCEGHAVCDLVAKAQAHGRALATGQGSDTTDTEEEQA